jgi:radical SAM enzyme (rSAM/lipoprotein system)
MFIPIQKAAYRKFRKLETRRHELNYLFWECTTRCNLNCLHCGSDCYQESPHRDMPLDDFLCALDTIENPANHFTVVLTGGEPLMRKDLEECGKEIRKRGMRWGIVSNGLLYDQARQVSLLNAGMGALTLSLDGMERSHNWLRNNGTSFQKVDQAISLAAASKRLHFDVVTCVNQKNLHELPEIYRYLLGNRVRSWRLFTITPIGRAVNHPELSLSGPALRTVMDFITRLREKGLMDVKFSCEGYVGTYEPKVRDTPFFCRAGINVGSVLIDGSISACPNIDRSFAQGNIYQDNLYEVWKTRFQPFRDRSWTRRGKCGDCKDFADCQGNGFHYWHGDRQEPLVCHKELLEET